MPTRLWILRVVIGLMCIGFAHFLGRSLVGGSGQARRGTGSASWGLRTALAGGAVLWGTGIDILVIVVYVLAIFSGVAGFFLRRRPKEPEDDLTKEMFPDD